MDIKFNNKYNEDALAFIHAELIYEAVKEYKLPLKLEKEVIQLLIKYCQ